MQEEIKVLKKIGKENAGPKAIIVTKGEAEKEGEMVKAFVYTVGSRTGKPRNEKTWFQRIKEIKVPEEDEEGNKGMRDFFKKCGYRFFERGKADPPSLIGVWL